MNPAYDLPEHFYFGGGPAETMLTPASACLFALALLLMLALPRKYAIFPFLMAGLLIPAGQVIVVAGLHLVLYRILVLAGLVRMLWVRLVEGSPVLPRFNTLDRVLVAWAVCNAIAYILLWGTPAITNRLGLLYGTLGVYFWLRYLIRGRDDIIRAVTALSIVAGVVAAGMLLEHRSGANHFSALLQDAVSTPAMRAGQIRSQGPFAQSIVAGVFGAALLPLFLALWNRPACRVVAVLGAISATVITITSSSSTPLLTYIAGLASAIMWPLRRHMRIVRWSIVLGLLVLQAAMTAPVWWIFARLGGVLGGSGWHRSELINQFVRHIGDWWLVGSRDAAGWGADTWDCINAYVRAGVDGGLVTFILFLSLVIVAYRAIGKARAAAQTNLQDERLLWGVGGCLFANTVAFFGIIYFDQSVIVWYTILVMISAAARIPGVAKERKTATSDTEVFPATPSPAGGENRWFAPSPLGR